MPEYDHFNWTDERLQDRYFELSQLAKIPHAETRQQEIEHELNCLAFEVGQRLIEAANGCEPVVVLELPND